MKTRDLVLTGLMIAVVYIITVTIVVPIPQTRGIFNLGEAGVYIAALLFGPVVGALSGGLGSMLADLTVAPHYAFFTLVIKGLEGLVVGLVARGIRLKAREAVGLGVVSAAVLAVAAPVVWRNRAADWPAQPHYAALVILPLVLAGAAAVLTLIPARAASGPGSVGRRLVAMLAGGAVMVAGYFATQAFVFRLGVPVAAVEIPFNLVQVAVGVIAGLAVSAAVTRAMPSLAR